MTKTEKAQLTNGEKVIRFIEEVLPCPGGHGAGEKMKLQDWQKRFITDIYDNPKAKTRKAILSIARKNGKSQLISCIAMAHLVGPMRIQGGQTLVGANTRDQAALIFDSCVKMISASPELQQVTRIIASRKTIYGLRNNTELRCVASDSTGAQGFNASLVIIDELGQVRGTTGSGPDFVAALETCQGAQVSPLMCVISTQAAQDADLLSQMIDDGLKGADPSIVVHLYTAPQDCDLLDESAWLAANPGLNTIRSIEDLRKNMESAQRIPALENNYRNLLLNQRVDAESGWLAYQIWESNNAAPIMEDFTKYPVTIGLDLSSAQDLTAAIFSVKNSDGIVSLLPLIFTPANGLDQREMRDRASYRQWVKEGKLIAVPGAVVDFDFVAGYLAKFVEDYEIKLTSIQFDRWNINAFKKAAERQGFAKPGMFIEVGQGYKTFSPLLTKTETLLLQEKIRHGNHPLLNLAIASCRIESDAAGNRKLTKKNTVNRIDAAVAFVMSLAGIDDKPAAPFSLKKYIV